MSFTQSAIDARTHRLINSRYPTIGVFDEFADNERELRIAFELEQATNPRLNHTMGALSFLPEGSLLEGPTASLGMAAFIHADDNGSRFNDGKLGAWYAALDSETAIAETLYHNDRRLRASADGFPNRIQLRELIVIINSRLLDIRGAQNTHPDLYHIDNYRASQSFANSVRWPLQDPGEDGIVFDSLRNKGGQNICMFRPQALPLPILQGDHYQYEWDVSGKVETMKLIGLS
jgi:RES domain-containing protein